MKQAAAAPLRTLASWKAQFDIRRASVDAAPLLRAVLRATRQAFDSNDVDWFDRIEQRRRQLLDSAEPVNKMDFGARSHTDSLSESQMLAGSLISTTLGAECLLSSKPPGWGRFLYSVVGESGSTRALELGTSLGLSAVYQGAALAASNGSLTTLEGSPEIAEAARTTIDEIGLAETVDVVVGRFDETLPMLLDEGQPFDYVFIDGHHDEAATLKYFEHLKSHVVDGAVLVFDDIHWSDGMKRAWNAIRDDRSVAVAVDMRTLGIVRLGSAGCESYRYFLLGSDL